MKVNLFKFLRSNLFGPCSCSSAHLTNDPALQINGGKHYSLSFFIHFLTPNSHLLRVSVSNYYLPKIKKKRRRFASSPAGLAAQVTHNPNLSVFPTTHFKVPIFIVFFQLKPQSFDFYMFRDKYILGFALDDLHMLESMCFCLYISDLVLVRSSYYVLAFLYMFQ